MFSNHLEGVKELAFATLEMAASHISKASNLLAKEIQKHNREYKDAPYSKAFSRLTMAILGDMLSQAAVLKSWYYCNKVSLAWYQNAGCCVYRLTSKLNYSSEVIVNLKYEDAQSVLKEVCRNFQSTDSFAAHYDYKNDQCTFFMNV